MVKLLEPLRFQGAAPSSLWAPAARLIAERERVNKTHAGGDARVAEVWLSLELASVLQAAS